MGDVLLPTVRRVRDALATSLLLLLPWSVFAAAALAGVGAWMPALWLAVPAGGALVALAGMATDPRPRPPARDDRDGGDGGDGGSRRDDDGPPPPRPDGGLTADPDWAAFDAARSQWQPRVPAGV